jgi:hypothetical protein
MRGQQKLSASPARRAPRGYWPGLVGGVGSKDGDLSIEREWLAKTPVKKDGLSQERELEDVVLMSWRNGMSEEEIVEITGLELHHVRAAVQDAIARETRIEDANDPYR